MKNSKLIAYLKTLSSLEIRDFGQYIKFKTSKNANNVNTLFNYLKRLHPIYPEKKIDRDYVLKKLYGSDDNKKLLNSIYKLSVLLDDFLILDVLNSKIKDKNFLLLDALKQRKLDKYFFKKTEQIQEEWEKKTYSGIDHLYDEYRLKEICYSHPNYSMVQEMPISPELLINHLDRHYFTTKLYWNVCIYNNNSYIINSTSEKKEINTEYFIDEIINLCNHGNFNTVPQAKLFGNFLAALINKDYSNFESIKEEFIQNIDLYNYKEKNNVMTFLYHSCYENYKNGNPNALNQLFELNCLAVKYELIIVDGYINSERFFDIVHIGFAAKKLEWTESFINDYDHYLQNSERQDTITLCKALLSFNKENYESALQILAIVKFQNLLYVLYAKSIQLQCYYELDEGYYDLFFNLTKSFNLYINRKDCFSDSTKKTFINFISVTKQLYNAKYNPEPNLVALSKKINNTSNIAYKSWIIKKMSELLQPKQRA